MKKTSLTIILLIFFSFWTLRITKSQNSDQTTSDTPSSTISFFYDMTSASLAVIFLTNLVGKKFGNYGWPMGLAFALLLSAVGAIVEHQLSLSEFSAKDMVPILLNALFIASAASGGNEAATVIANRLLRTHEGSELNRLPESGFFKSWF